MMKKLCRLLFFLIIILVDFSLVTTFFRSEQLCTFLWRPKPFFFSFPQKNYPFDYAESLSEVLQDRIWQKIDLLFAYPQSKAIVRIVRNNPLFFIFMKIKHSRKYLKLQVTSFGICWKDVVRYWILVCFCTKIVNTYSWSG